MVFGADGVKSRVRKQLLALQKLVDTEGRGIVGKTNLTPEFLAKFDQRPATGLGILQDRRENFPLT